MNKLLLIACLAILAFSVIEATGKAKISIN